jgi:hypothetical protein
LDSYQYESNTLTWHDLSGNGNDFFWSNIPTTDYTKGFLNMNNLFLKGPVSSTLLNNNKFTIVLVINREIENKVVKDEDGEQYKYLLTVPGNEKNSFEISIDKENHINYHGDGNTIYRTENPIILYNKSVLTFTYENSRFSAFQDSIQLLSRHVGKFYFNNNNIIINKNKDLNINIYGFLSYNREISKAEIEGVRDYFITNTNKNNSTSSSTTTLLPIEDMFRLLTDPTLPTLRRVLKLPRRLVSCLMDCSPPSCLPFRTIGRRFGWRCRRIAEARSHT